MKNLKNFINIGLNEYLYINDIIGLFDMESTTISSITKDFLTHSQKNNIVKNISSKIPYSFILINEPSNLVFTSPVSASTLIKRLP